MTTQNQQQQHQQQQQPEQFRIGISACLLGQPVRFNGGHKRDRFCAETLAGVADLVPVCPELAIGLPVPRPAIRQVLRGDVIAVEPSKPLDAQPVPAHPVPDYAPALAAQAHKFLTANPGLDGFVFMHDSPSCGSRNVKRYQANGYPAAGKGMGAFARALTEANPLMPFEDAGRLNDPVLRENFMVRLGAYREWRQLCEPTSGQPLTLGRLIRYYSPYKYQLMAHSQQAYREVGRILANHGRKPIDQVAQEFIAAFMVGLSQLASRRSHSNVLLHLLGYFKRQLPAQDRQELLACIEEYRLGVTPLIAPLTLMKHHLTRLPHEYLCAQKYWQPHAPALGLRSVI